MTLTCIYFQQKETHRFTLSINFVYLVKMKNRIINDQININLAQGIGEIIW